MRVAFIACATLLAQPALAQGYTLTSAGGHAYETTCNADGYVLRSLAPVSRFIGEGAATQIIRREEQIYLGQSCDAFLPDIGMGTWCWANGGIFVEIGTGSIGFPRQELYCPSNDTLGVDCRC